jgi:hypothetical protein
MNVTELTALVVAGCALIGVLTHIAVYSYREGRKEQRLLVVEEKVKNLPAIEVMLATLGTGLSGVQTRLEALTGDINAIRNHLLGGQK